MAATIKIKNSSTAGAAPTSSDLVQGELAVNVTDKRLYTENSSGTIVELGTNPSVPVTFPDGSASAPSLTNDGDTNTGLFFPAADTVGIATGGSERARVDSSGNLGLGVTPSAWGSGYKAFQIGERGSVYYSGGYFGYTNNAYWNGSSNTYIQTGYASDYYTQAGSHVWRTAASGTAGNAITFTQAMTLDASGNLLVGKTASSSSTAGAELQNGVGGSNAALLVADGQAPLVVNRLTNDGTLVSLRQAGTEEGTISVSGTTVSYNGGHLARFAQTVGAKDESLVKGTVLSNLDEMNVYTDAEGNPVANEQLNKVKVSDTEGDANVAGVFVNWSHDDEHNVDEINMAMTGDMIIRIAQGTAVARGDLLMSAGDGTAKPQGDDIVRAKTIAKVTSTHVTCTYEDGSYCVPCVLMAC